MEYVMNCSEIHDAVDRSFYDAINYCMIPQKHKLKKPRPFDAALQAVCLNQRNKTWQKILIVRSQPYPPMKIIQIHQDSFSQIERFIHPESRRLV